MRQGTIYTNGKMLFPADVGLCYSIECLIENRFELLYYMINRVKNWGAHMATVIDNPKIKQKCQIFTPAEKVSRMLDMAGYADDLFGKKVLENSCGDGEFLVQIVERYITDAVRRGFTIEQIRDGLARDIIAYDVDEKMVEKCKCRLDETATRFSIAGVVWNVSCKDFLEQTGLSTFDYIVGNPPYIAYSDLPNDVQQYVKRHFETCKKGKFDYCYAFIEKSYKSLSDGGCLLYLIPSNIFKNVFGEEIRKLILSDLEMVVEFPNEKVFENALVSPAIIKIRKGLKAPHFHYSEKFEKAKQIEKNQLAERWFFDLPENRRGRKIGDNYQVSHPVATLLNDAFVLKDGVIQDGYYILGNDRIEMEIVRVAASPKHKRNKNYTEHIIFPYAFDDQGNLLRFREDEMQRRFPGAVAYLSKFKTALEKRDADTSAQWYEYGRSQAIRNLIGPKILISKVISECTEAYLLDKDEIPYSGIYIKALNDANLAELIEILASKRFKQYIYKVGLSVSGTSRRIITKDIEEYIY